MSKNEKIVVFASEEVNGINGKCTEPRLRDSGFSLDLVLSFENIVDLDLLIILKMNELIIHGELKRMFLYSIFQPH